MDEKYKITKIPKRVLILGAGSSASYGFPTGEDLKKIIQFSNTNMFYSKQNLNESDYYLNRNALNTYYNYIQGFTRKFGAYEMLFSAPLGCFIIKEIEKFKSMFQKSGSATIDSFISHQNDQELELISKFLISLVIRSFSEEGHINQPTSKDDWMTYFFNRNFDYNDNYEEELPVIISFNYDNLFKNKLRKYFTNRFDEEKAEEILSKIPFIHIYGNIEDREYMPISISPSDQSYPPSLVHDLEESMKRINFVRGGGSLDPRDYLESDNLLDLGTTIGELLEKVEEIYILGYGFDKFNNQILFDNSDRLKSLSKDKIKGVTGFGLPDYVKGFFESAASKGPAFPSEHCVNNYKCREVLVGYMESDMFPNELPNK